MGRKTRRRRAKGKKQDLRTTKELVASDEDFGVPRLDATADHATALAMRKAGRPFLLLGVAPFVAMSRKWTLEHIHGSKLAEEVAVVQQYDGQGFTFCEPLNGTGCDHRKYTMSLRLLIDAVRDGESPTSSYAALPSEAAAAAFREAAAAHPALGDPSAVGAEAVDASLRLGFSNVSYNCHHDYHDNAIVALHGTRSVTLWPPSEGPLLYVHDDTHASARQSRVDFGRAGGPDFGAFPLAATARAARATMRPGEALYVPPLWFHHVVASPSRPSHVTDEPDQWPAHHVAVNAFLVTSMRSRMERALLLTPWSAQPYLQLGADRFEAGEVAEAHAFFAAAARMQPQLPSAHFNAAVSLRRAGGDAARCAAMLDAALNLAPTYEAAHIERAKLISDGKTEEGYREAVRLLTAARKMSPRSAAWKGALGDQLANLGGKLTARRAFDEAKPLLRRALELSPRSVDAYNNLGVALSFGGEPLETGRVQAAYRGAIALQPASAPLRYKFGSLLAQADSDSYRDEAWALLASAVALKPECAAARAFSPPPLAPLAPLAMHGMRHSATGGRAGEREGGGGGGAVAPCPSSLSLSPTEPTVCDRASPPASSLPRDGRELPPRRAAWPARTSTSPAPPGWRAGRRTPTSSSTLRERSTRRSPSPGASWRRRAGCRESRGAGERKEGATQHHKFTTSQTGLLRQIGRGRAG